MVPRGGTIVWMMPSIISSLMPYNYPEAQNMRAGMLVNRGLSDVGADGNTIPILAAKIPTIADGDVSSDLLTVTWKLKDGLKWSDGEPVTSDDLKFTWEVCGNAANGCRQSSGLTDITSVDTPDPQTIVLHYKQPYFDYALQFRWGILPRHSPDVGAPSDVARWKYNTTVNPNLGPFSVTEFVPNDHLTFVRNSNFYLASEGQPYLDGISMPLRADQETIRRALLTGENDLSAYIGGGAAELKEIGDKGFTVFGGPSPYMNQLLVNQWDRKDPTRTKPHPILGDANVRQAILLASNPDEWMGLYNSDYYQFAQVNYRFSLWGGEYTCDMQTLPYDPDQAKALLDAAGWAVGSDGIRVKDGQRLAVTAGTYSGYGMEALVQVWLNQLKQVGIEGTVESIDNGVMYAGYAGGSPLYLGDFDLIMSDYGKDQGSAQNDSNLMYPSDMIPSPTNAVGINFTGVKDAQVDEWVKAANTEVDQSKRNDLYCSIEKRVNQELFTERWVGFGPGYGASNPKLKGVTKNELYTIFGFDSESWYLEQ